MSNFEKEFYVPMRDLIRLYDSSDPGEAREITAIVYPHRETQLQNLDCRKFVIVDDVEILQKEIETLKAELAKERSVVDFYADIFNWHESIEGTRVFDRTSVSDVGSLIGGRVARQRQKERK